jgi:hypothetical protein
MCYSWISDRMRANLNEITSVYKNIQQTEIFGFCYKFWFISYPVEYILFYFYGLFMYVWSWKCKNPVNPASLVTEFSVLPIKVQTPEHYPLFSPHGITTQKTSNFHHCENLKSHILSMFLKHFAMPGTAHVLIFMKKQFSNSVVLKLWAMRMPCMSHRIKVNNCNVLCVVSP